MDVSGNTARARELIEGLALAPHPEGGYFREIHRSADKVFSPRANGPRHCLTDIYFLLLAGQVSRFHRVLHDELWHFHEGAPLLLLTFDEASGDLRSTRLDPAARPPCFSHCVSGGTWQAAVSRGAYSLVGCSVAPGFDFADFAFLADHPEAAARLRLVHPDHAHLL